MADALVVGVDLGGTRVRAALADERGEFMERVEVPTLAAEGLDAVLDRILAVIREVTEGVSGISAIGIGAPGPINSRTGLVTTPPNLPGWLNVPLASIVQERMGLPTSLGNDANLAALGEFSFGAGRDVDHLIYMTVSTGIGGGVVVGGRLLEGQLGAAGELGHIVVEPDGPRCTCGGRGHLEVLASGTAIGWHAREAIAGGRRTRLVEFAGGDPSQITARTVSQAAEASDELALELITAAGRYLGWGVSSLIHTFNPQMVALGGGVSNAGELLFGPLREVVDSEIMPVFKEGLQIVPASLGRDVGLLGAVALALQTARTGE